MAEELIHEGEIVGFKPEYTTGQKNFLEAIAQGKNVFLTGKAGTGKSFITKEAIRLLKKDGRRVVAVAPTGIAANNVGGTTIHSTFSLNPFGVMQYKTCNFLKSEKRRFLAAIDVIFIDEVSMMRADILDGINWTLIKNGCAGGLESKQIVFIGDMRQLKAIADDNLRSVMLQTYDGVEFPNAKIYKKLDVVTVDLDEVLRQTDEEFILHLNTVRDGGKSQYFKKFLTDISRGIVLAPHNATVARYNDKGFQAIDSQEIVFDAVVDGNVKADEFNLESRIRVKDGCKIMYLANSKNNNLVNGTLGIFREDEGTYFIDVEGCMYALEPQKFTKKEYVLDEASNSLELQEIGSITQMPIRLAYALSIHKSQGLTFDEVTVDLSLPCFAEGQLYVALSRVRTPGGLSIIVNR